MRRADGFEPIRDTGNQKQRRQVDTSELRRMADAVSALERPVGHGNLAVRTSLLGVEITSRGLPFWAKITGLHDDGLGTTCYSFSELWDDGAGNFAVLDNGRKGFATVPINQAYEVTKNATVPTDGTAIVIMWLSYNAITYEFWWPGGSATTFTAPVTFTANVTFTGPLVFTWTTVTLAGEVKFPTTTSVSVAPAAVLIVPTLIVGAAIGGGPPTYSSTVGALICDGKYLWQNGGTTDWYGYWPIKSTDFATSIAVTGGIPYLTGTGTTIVTSGLTYTTTTGLLVTGTTGGYSVTTTDAVTNTTTTVEAITHNSSNTVTTNFGLVQLVRLQSSTTADTTAVTITTTWATATHAHRKPRYTIGLTDGDAGTLEMIRGETDGAVVQVSILGGAVVTNVGLIVRAPSATYTALKVQAAATPSADVFMIANSGGTAQVRVDSTFKTWFVAGTTAGASLNIASGVAPTSPVEGDIWYDGTHLYFEDSSGAVDLLSGMAIGAPVSGGTAGYALYVDGSGNLAQTNNLQLTSTSGGAAFVGVSNSSTTTGHLGLDAGTNAYGAAGLYGTLAGYLGSKNNHTGVDSAGYFTDGTRLVDLCDGTSAVNLTGPLRLSGSTSGFVGFIVPAAAGSTTYTLPAADGSAGDSLQTDASGNLSWGPSSSTTGTSGQVAVAPAYALTGSFANVTSATFTAPATGTYIVLAKVRTSDSSGTNSQITCKLRNTTSNADLEQDGETEVAIAMTQVTITMPLLAVAALTSGDVVYVQGKTNNAGQVVSVTLLYVRLA